MIKVFAFKWVPPFAQGFVRDLRIRWALEEAGIPYEEKLVDFTEVKSEDYRRAVQPFGQVPAIEENGKTLFESGAILLHLAERSQKLAPADSYGRAKVQSWAVAALSTVEPFVQWYNNIDDADAGAVAMKAKVKKMLESRLGDLQAVVQDTGYLEGNFSAADVLMSCVLREVKDDIMKQFPKLAAYRERCIERPAFKKALSDQLATFKKHAPAAT